MPFDKAHDLVVIGSGPAGEGATMRAAKAGASVVVIERGEAVGGGCTHWATIPSKALRHAVGQVLAFRKNPVFAATASQVEASFPAMLRSAESVIAKQVSMRRDFYGRNHVSVVHGHASFVSPHTIEIATEGTKRRLHGKKFIVAVGSRPYRPPDVDFSHPRIVDSDTILKLPSHPRSITIYGAGVIGSEYASIFANLGIKVNLVNTQSRLLAFMDEEITEGLSYHLRDQGVTIRHNEEYDRVEPREHDVVLHLKSGRRLKSDVLLWANGRTGNSANMNLDAIGLPVNGRGQLEVNAVYQTAIPHIYAVGDIIGYPALASSAYDQGRFALAHILDPERRNELFDLMPTGIYTIPEISSVGRTEQELAAENVAYESGYAYFKHLARAQMAGETVGMLKLIFHADTREVLGVHCFGDRASEIVHIGQAIMATQDGGPGLDYFIDTTFNYPTMAEAYRVAALNGLNRLA